MGDIPVTFMTPPSQDRKWRLDVGIVLISGPITWGITIAGKPWRILQFLVRSWSGKRFPRLLCPQQPLTHSSKSSFHHQKEKLCLRASWAVAAFHLYLTPKSSRHSTLGSLHAARNQLPSASKCEEGRGNWAELAGVGGRGWRGRFLDNSLLPPTSFSSPHNSIRAKRKKKKCCVTTGRVPPLVLRFAASELFLPFAISRPIARRGGVRGRKGGRWEFSSGTSLPLTTAILDTRTHTCAHTLLQLKPKQLLSIKVWICH